MPVFKEEPEFDEDVWTNHGDSMVDFHYSSDDEKVNDALPQPPLVVEPPKNAVKELDLQPGDVETLTKAEHQITVAESLVANDGANQNNPSKNENELLAEDIENSDDVNEENDDNDNEDHGAIIEKPHLIEKRLAQTLKRRLWKNKYDATPVQCTFEGCNKMIKRRAIYSHMAAHKGKMQCDICSDLLSTRRSLLNHMQKHYPCDRRICEVCGLTLSTPQVLRKHQRKVHSMASQYTMERNINTTLNSLMRTIEMEQQREAKKRDKSRKDLAPDELMARKEQRRIWKNMYDDELVKCDVAGCEESYKRRAKYTHMAKHNGIEFKCKLCNSLLQSKRALDNHIRRHATNGRISKALSKDPMERRERRRIWKNNYDDTVVQCKFDGCNESIKRRALYHHMAKHKGQSQSQLMICDICNSKFLSKRELRQHLTAHVKND